MSLRKVVFSDDISLIDHILDNLDYYSFITDPFNGMSYTVVKGMVVGVSEEDIYFRRFFEHLIIEYTIDTIYFVDQFTNEIVMVLPASDYR